MFRAVFASALVAVLALSCGCSTPAFDTTPFTRGDPPGGAADEQRINAWPFFYYREPALSVLWPVFTANDRGHALLPLYEYDRPSQQLRLGTFHPWLPPVGSIEQGGSRWRVLTARRDAASGSLDVWPLYAHRGHGNYVRVLNWIRDQRSDSLAVWPLLRAQRDRSSGRVLNFAWSDGGRWQTLFPLYFHEREKWLLLAPVLYRDRERFWTPLFGASVPGEQRWAGVLPPLFLWRRDHDVTHWHAPLPLVHAWSGPEEMGFDLLPIARYERSAQVTLFSLGQGYVFDLDARSGGSRVLGWLWPLGTARWEPDQHSSRFVPLWWQSRSGADRYFVSIPYWSVSGADGRWQSWLGLVHRFSGKAGTGHGVLPLYAWGSRGSDDFAFFSLLGAYHRSPEGSLFDLLGPLYFQRDKAGTHYRSALFPLLHAWRDAFVSGSALLPVYWFERGPELWRFYSLPFSLERSSKSGSSLAVALVLFMRQSSPSLRSTHVLFPFTGSMQLNEPEPRHLLWAFPLFLWDRSPTQRSLRSLPLRVSYERAPGSDDVPSWELRTWRLFLGTLDFTVRRERDVRPDAPVLQERLWELDVLYGLSSLRFERQPNGATASHQCWLWWLVARDVEQRASGGGSKGSTGVLWPLYQSQWDGAQSHQRLLVYLFRREVRDAHTSVDAFPFISYDRDRDLLQWSFLGGLLGWRARGEERRLKLLFVPIDLS